MVIRYGILVYIALHLSSESKINSSYVSFTNIRTPHAKGTTETTFRYPRV
jgi:hypothetical protein